MTLNVESNLPAGVGRLKALTLLLNLNLFDSRQVADRKFLQSISSRSHTCLASA